MSLRDESRVLCLGEGLAALSVPTTLVSRLGRDPFGDLVEGDLAGGGVRVPAEHDDLRSTGAYSKQGTDAGSRMHDCRAGSLRPTLAAAREAYGCRLSVDLSWRPALWYDRDVRPLLDLLRAGADLLLGADEAEAVLCTSDPDRLRERVRKRPHLVTKSDARAALEVEPDGTAVEVPALQAEEPR